MSEIILYSPSLKNTDGTDIMHPIHKNHIYAKLMN